MPISDELVEKARDKTHQWERSIPNVAFRAILSLGYAAGVEDAATICDNGEALQYRGGRSPAEAGSIC